MFWRVTPALHSNYSSVTLSTFWLGLNSKLYKYITALLVSTRCLSTAYYPLLNISLAAMQATNNSAIVVGFSQ